MTFQRLGQSLPCPPALGLLLGSSSEARNYPALPGGEQGTAGGSGETHRGPGLAPLPVTVHVPFTHYRKFRLGQGAKLY